MTGNQDRVKEFIEHSNACGYFQLLNMEVQEAEPGKSRLRVAIGDKHLNPFGTVHGGVYCSALDAAIFFACFSKLDAGQKMTSVEVKVNFLVPARAGEIIAEGSLVYQGRSILVGEGRIVDPTGLTLAKGVGTCMVLPRAQSVEGINS